MLKISKSFQTRIPNRENSKKLSHFRHGFQAEKNAKTSKSFQAGIPDRDKKIQSLWRPAPYGHPIKNVASDRNNLEILKVFSDRENHEIFKVFSDWDSRQRNS